MKKFAVKPHDAEVVQQLSRELRLSPLTAQLLNNRGVTDSKSAAEFLKPDLSQLYDPFLFEAMHAAIARIERALREKEKIMVFGDYDVDGVTGTALLYKFFRLLEAQVEYYIPYRGEGYSLSQAALGKFAQENVKLVITVDCGTSNVEELEWAHSAGIDVIVLDHHEPPKHLPQHGILINPKLPPLQAPTRYPFSGLSAVGVAFKLVWAVTQKLVGAKKTSREFQDFLFDAVALVALGAIADIVPLVQENRVFVHYGLDALRHGRNLGLRALLKSAKLDGEKLEPWHVSFMLAPRLNAAGRMNTAKACVELLTTSLPEQAEKLAEELERSNRERQAIESQVLKQARQRIGQEVNLESEKAIVLADERWHQGVIGIVASRLVEEFRRPVALISWNDGVGRGSVRSVEGFHVQEALEHSRSALLTQGGHPLAGGLSLKRDQFEQFRSLFQQRAREVLTAQERDAVTHVDAKIDFKAITPEWVQELEQLKPFGCANPKPLFWAEQVHIVGEPKLLGREGKHLQIHMAQNHLAFRAVAFRGGAWIDKIRGNAKTYSVAFELHRNHWQNRETIELQVEALEEE